MKFNVSADLIAFAAASKYYGAAADRYAALGYLDTETYDKIVEAKRKFDARNAKSADTTKQAYVPAGRGEIEGTITYVKWKRHEYGASLKCIVLRPDGTKVWGTVPKPIVDWSKQHLGDLAIEKAVVGMHVGFVATMEPKQGEPQFGFFKCARRAVVNPVLSLVRAAITAGEIHEDVFEAVADRLVASTNGRGQVKAGTYDLD